MAKRAAGTIVGEQAVTELEKGRRWRVTRITNGLNLLNLEDYIEVVNGTPCNFNGTTYPEFTLRVLDAAFTNEGLPAHQWKTTIELQYNPQTWERPQDGWKFDLLPFERLQLPQ